MNCPPSPPYLVPGADLDGLLAAANGDGDAAAGAYGFDSWVALRTEVGRRAILDDLDAEALQALVAEQPRLATEPMRRWCDHPLGPTPLSYVGG